MYKTSILLSAALILFLGCDSSSSSDSDKSTSSTAFSSTANSTAAQTSSIGNTSSSLSSSTSSVASNTSSANNTQTSSSSSVSSSASLGACVTYPRLKAGDVYTIRSKQQGISIDVRTTVKKFTDTEAELDILSSGAVSGTGHVTQKYSIANNYIDITKIETTNTTSTQGYTINTVATIDISPYLRNFADKVCENESYSGTRTMTTNTQVMGTSNSVTNSVDYKISILAINEAKNGYNTFKMRNEDFTSSLSITTWIDINTGLLIYQETKNTNSGAIVSTQEIVN